MLYNNYPLPLPDEAVPLMIVMVFLLLFFPNGLEFLAPVVFSMGLISLGAILLGIILFVYFAKHLVSSIGTMAMFLIFIGLIVVLGH